MITQNNRQVGAIGLFTINENAKLTRHENSGVVPDQAATPALDFTKVGIVQGFVERSNVNPVMEMTRLIGVSRAFDAISSRDRASRRHSLRDAVKTLGSNG